MARQRGIVVPINATDNTERAFQEVNARIAELQERSRRAEQGARGLGNGLAEGMGHATPQIAAASGAIRELEGNLPIRAVERFLTTTLGLGPALAAAFPVVGAVAFAGVLAEMLGKLVSLYEAGVRAPVEMGRAFDQLTDKLELSTAELDLNNARLQEQIDKIEGHKNNGIQVALEEARVSADKLLDSLVSDIKAMDELLKQHEVSRIQSAFTGVASTVDLSEAVKNDGDKLTDAATDATHNFNAALLGAKGDKDKIAAAKRDYFAQLDREFGDFIGKYQAKADQYKKLQKDTDAAVSVAANSRGEYGSQIAGAISSDYGADINAAEGAVRAAQALRDRLRSTQQGDDLSQRLNVDKGDKDAAERASKARKQAEEIAAAQKDLAAAKSKAAEQSSQAGADAAKRSGETQLAALDDRHKRELISDRDYYAQKAAIQVAALNAEADADKTKQDVLRNQIQGLNVDKLRPSNDTAGRTKDDAKIIELQTQIGAIEEKRLGIVQKIADVRIEAAIEDYEATKKSADLTLELAAQLEQIRGGSTSARDAESRKRFDDKRRAAGPAGTTTIDALEGISDASTTESEASRGYQDVSSGASVARQRIAYDQASGALNSQDARKEKIAVDQQEAAALLPLIDAYQKLSDLGVEGSGAKVDELKEKFLELSNPVNQVAENIRTSLGGALETLFDNMDKGQKALESFGKSVQKIVLDQTYRQFVAPAVQSGLSALVPNRAGSKSPSVASALGGLIPGLGGIKGAVGLKGGGAGDITVQIINQGSPLTSGGASQQMSGGQQDDFASRVISVILKDAESNGSGIQAIVGAFQNG